MRFFPSFGFRSLELKPDIEVESRAKKEAEQALREVARKGSSLRALQGHTGWSEYQTVIGERLNGLYGQLASCKPEQLVLLQARIAELKFVSEIIPRAMADGHAAEQELSA